MRVVIAMEFEVGDGEDVARVLGDLLDAAATKPIRQTRTHVAVAEAADRIVAEFEH